MTTVAAFMGNGASSGYVKDSSLILDLDAGLSQSYSGTGTTWNDLSVTATSGTNSNLTYTNTGYFTYPGTSGSFTTVASNSAYTFAGTTPMTLEIWFRPSSAGIGSLYQGLFVRQSVPRDGFDMLFNYPSTGNAGIYVERYTNGSYGSGISYSTTPSTFINKWNHVIYTYTSTFSTLNLNGTVVSTTTTSSSFNSTASPLYIGGSSSIPKLNGDIAIARIYNRDLTYAEISQNFNAERGRFGL